MRGVVGTQLGQILLDSRNPLVVATSLGSIAAMAALITTPGASQFLGCVPVGWAQGLGSAAAATATAALAPVLIHRIPGVGGVVHIVVHADSNGGPTSSTDRAHALAPPVRPV
jgi:H+-transporting ATPase